MNDWDRIMAALETAVTAHADQVDKAGEPYVWHPFRVGFSLLPDVDDAVLGILHDIPEDQPHYADQARIPLAHDRELLLDLEALTREPGEAYEAYLARVGPRPRARRVKRADLADNLNPRRLQRAAEVIGMRPVLKLQRRYVGALDFLTTFDAAKI